MRLFRKTTRMSVSSNEDPDLSQTTARSTGIHELSEGKSSKAFTGHPNFFKRKYIVDPKLQITILVSSLGYVVFFMIILAVALFMPLLMQMNQLHPNAWRSSEAAKHLVYLHQWLWPACLIGLIIVAIHSIGVSHRIAGPLYRFRNVFAAMGDGVIPKPTRLRKGDLLHSEMDAVNDMLESLRSRIRDIEHAQRSLSDTIDTCKRECRAGGEFLLQLDQIKSRSEQLAEKLSHLKYEE